MQILKFLHEHLSELLLFTLTVFLAVIYLRHPDNVTDHLVTLALGGFLTVVKQIVDSTVKAITSGPQGTAEITASSGVQKEATITAQPVVE